MEINSNFTIVFCCLKKKIVYKTLSNRLLLKYAHKEKFNFFVQKHYEVIYTVIFLLF